MKVKLLNQYIGDAVKIVVGNLDDEIQARYGFTEVSFYEDGLEFLKGKEYLTSNSLRFDTNERILFRVIEDLLQELPQWMFVPELFQINSNVLKTYLRKSENVEEAITQIRSAVSFYSNNMWSCPLCSGDLCELSDASDLVEEMGLPAPKGQIWMCGEHALVLQITDFGAAYIYMTDLEKQEELNSKYAIYLDTLSSCRAELPAWFSDEKEDPTLSLAALEEISQLSGPEEEQDEDEEDDWEDDDYRSATLWSTLVQETARQMDKLILEKGGIEKFANLILKSTGEPGLFGYNDSASEESKESYVSPFTGKPV